MTGYEDLIKGYTATYEKLVQVSLIVTVLATILVIGWYIYRNVRKKKDRIAEDLKLQGYFEKYSDIIADKVIEKLKNNK